MNIGISWAGRSIEVEYRWTNATEEGSSLTAAQRASSPTPIMVFLHEGLGSVSMWKDFPNQLCKALGLRGLVYSRPGYGNSTPRPSDERWQPDFMHRQAFEVLPAFLGALAITPADQPIYLFGHSDGGSISLLYAARHSQSLAGIVVAAPHIMVEDITVENIQKAREAYRTTDLKQRLARHHADPDSAFWGWNQIWLDPRFTKWSIEDALPSISCPVLAIQGVDDEYGTMIQIDGIAARLPQTTLVKLAQCRHSPHKDQPNQVITAVRRFIESHP